MIRASSPSAVWDEVENGSYVADLELWAELATERDPVLDLGCGGGRVALPLAAQGHEVWAIDCEPALIRSVKERAAAAGLDLRALVADARAFDLDAEFGLILAPMQFLHLFETPDRTAILKRARSHLASDGRMAVALLDAPAYEEETWDAPDEVPLPDVREQDAWVFSSLPLSVTADDAGITIERLRQTVSPAGELTDERHTTRLFALGPGELEEEAAAAGLEAVGRREIAKTAEHIGSSVVILRRADAGERR